MPPQAQRLSSGERALRHLVHLSDLHFGRVDPSLIEPLVRQVSDLRPDVVVVSGDLTQRARRGQFVEARRFLDHLPQPQIVVPGNHDIPLYNLLRRFADPLRDYRGLITPDMHPEFIDDEIAVLGLNTARAFAFKGGRIGKEQIARVRARLGRLADHLTKIVVTHHPFELPAGYGDSALVGRASLAMQTFADCGADLLLSGHLHVSHATSTAVRYPLGGFAALAIQAGTATSTRVRSETNTFNLIRCDRDDVSIERMAWDAGSGRYESRGTEAFRYTGQGWLPLP